MKEVKMDKKGLFVAFEHLDGAGSTTQVETVSKILVSYGEKVHVTREPTDSAIGGLLRDVLKKRRKLDPLGTQLLFGADRADHLEEIIPLLAHGIHVISDRYYFSSIAYGSIGIKDPNWIADINRNFIDPDIVIYLKVSAEEALNRIDSGRHVDNELFEKIEYLTKVSVAYDELAQQHDFFVIIDGSQSKEKVTQDIMKALKDKLNLG